jgi:hypothetical protein
MLKKLNKIMENSKELKLFLQKPFSDNLKKMRLNLQEKVN